jgi:UDP-N-acetylmuramyl pentapeptide phosphotransferase/UDP-N-acetylglucosamine-1-phosphate transferase
MTIEIFWSYLSTLCLSAILVPFVNKAASALDIVAKENQRTIHHGRIARIGGMAVYLAFIIGSAIFLKADRQINAILVGGFIVFSIGFLDDIYDLPPKVKLLAEFVATTILVFYGDVSLKRFSIPFLPDMQFDYLATLVTFIWVIGITNAINLIDGLDGLCAGISTIVLVVIAFTSVSFQRQDIASISILLAGAICGFLCYNFHPASIFMGDCGALFIGFMISAISLLGFGYKSSAFFTLGAPIVMLAIPIMDTMIAILRRKLKKKKFSEADKEHLHHTLMFKLDLGQTRSVIILYMTTILFALSAYLYTYNKHLGLGIFLGLFLMFEIFVEYTEMISIHYKPLLAIVNIVVRSTKLPAFSGQRARMKQRALQKKQAQQKSDDALINIEKERLIMKNKKQKNIMVFITVALAIAVGVISGYFFLKGNEEKPGKVPPVQQKEDVMSYPRSDEETDLMEDIYDNLLLAIEAKDDAKIQEYVAAYFVADFFTWTNKSGREDVGGLTYVLPDARIDFGKYATNYYYVNFDEHLETYGQKGLPEVESYTVESVGASDFVYEKTGSSDSYDVSLKLQYVSNTNGMPTDELMSKCTVTLLKEEDVYYVVGVDYTDIDSQVSDDYTY